MKRTTEALALTSALLVGGCSADWNKPVDRHELGNNIAAGHELGQAENRLLGRLAMHPQGDDKIIVRAPDKNVVRLDEGSQWGSVEKTYKAETGSCAVKTTARLNIDDTVGGWSSNGLTPQPAVYNLSIAYEGQEISFTTPANTADDVEGVPATMTQNHITYKVGAKATNTERPLTDTAIAQAEATVNAMLDVCKVTKPDEQ